MRVNPDVLGVEEIDHYDDFFSPALALLGYEGAFVPKAVSPCLQFGYYSDGVALFWRTELVRRSSHTTLCVYQVIPEWLASALRRPGLRSCP